METISLDFINSDFGDYRSRMRIDRLGESEWRQEFIQRWKLNVSSSVSNSTLQTLREVRHTMWQIIESLNKEKEPSARDIKKLNRFISSSNLQGRIFYQDGKFELNMLPPKRNWNWVIVEIILDFAQLLSERDLKRFKICVNENCRWVFYDASKSGERLYCGNACSILVRVRRFRERQITKKK